MITDPANRCLHALALDMTAYNAPEQFAAVQMIDGMR
jgi:hypothetical protein